MTTPVTQGIEAHHTDPAQLVRYMLSDPDAAWSIGGLGAIAEFAHVTGEPRVAFRPLEGGGEVVMDRGAVRVQLCKNIHVVAYEGLSGRPDGWTQAIAFCSVDRETSMGQRHVLTELGPDRQAARANAQDAVAFDLGLDFPHFDFCVRTNDPLLIQELRHFTGCNVLAGDNAARTLIATIRKASPDRVVISRLGRIEACQPIPTGPDATTPEGPHTHLLPRLLNRRRTHSADVPVPEGMIPVLTLHPPSPVSDRWGKNRPFDAACHGAFQSLLRAFAPHGYHEEKQRIISAVLAGSDPAACQVAETRVARRAARITLRQLMHTHPHAPNLSAWLRRFDCGAGPCHVDSD